MERSSRWPVLLVAALPLLVAACPPAVQEPPQDTQPVEDTADTAVEEPGPVAPLNSSHEGWDDPLCWSCHMRPVTHYSRLLPHECVPCHGKNGSGYSHTDIYPCYECHERVHGLQQQFPDPDSCFACHEYPW